MSEDAHDPHTAWEDFADRLKWTATLFGAPDEIAGRHFITRATAVLLATWLSALEALARALLLRVAADLSVGCKPKVLAPPRASEKRAARMGPPPLDASSANWPCVRFRYLPRTAGSRGERRAAPYRFVEAAHFARRFEALIRVCENRDACARRLAALLSRRGEAAARILAPPNDRGPAWVPWPAVREAQAAAWDAFDTG